MEIQAEKIRGSRLHSTNVFPFGFQKQAANVRLQLRRHLGSPFSCSLSLQRRRSIWNFCLRSRAAHRQCASQNGRISRTFFNAVSIINPCFHVFSQFYRFQPRFQHHLRRSANHSGSPTSSNDRFLLDNEWVRYIISHCSVSIRPRKGLARNGKELHIHVHDLAL